MSKSRQLKWSRINLAAYYICILSLIWVGIAAIYRHIILFWREMSHSFGQDNVRGPLRNLHVPLRRQRRRRRRPGVWLLSVMELVVLVLDPVEFEKVNGQQDDAQEKHEADDQRHGKPSESHPAATPPQPREARWQRGGWWPGG